MKRGAPLLGKGMRITALVWILAKGAPMTLIETVFADGNDINTMMALDVEYQAAVERSDVKTMDRILADASSWRPGPASASARRT
jgi:hypothetical protein